jgi:hypothetical protein
VPTYHPTLDTAELYPWSAVRDGAVAWSGLLLGNGASIAVADTFAYSSLYDVSRSPNCPHPLTPRAERLFAELQTTNFEFVLASLKISHRVCEATGVSAPGLPGLYSDIQHALFEAVAQVHVEWELVAFRTLGRIRTELMHYRSVYSTNYDLLVYWAMMHEDNQDAFKDFFLDPDGAFDATDVEPWGNPTLVYFLHGGSI